MPESENNPKVKMQLGADFTFPVGKAAKVVAAYQKLLVVLNELGYYPESYEEAKLIAKEVLAQGWIEE